MDVTMEPGVDFAETIQDAVGSSGALVALISEEWLTVTDARGHRRIDDPADVHRMEIEAALDRQVRLIPALVQDAEMPGAHELPEEPKPLVPRQAVELSDHRWDYDVGRLVSVLERVLTDAMEAGRPAGRAAPFRRRGRRAVGRIRRLAVRYRGRAGFVAGALTTLVVTGRDRRRNGLFRRAPAEDHVLRVRPAAAERVRRAAMPGPSRFGRPRQERPLCGGRRRAELSRGADQSSLAVQQPGQQK